MGTGDGQVIGITKILDNGPNDARYNIVLVAEGFRDTEQTDFNDFCEDFVDAFRNEPWFDTLIAAINIHRLNVESDESGADDPAEWVDGGDTYCRGGTGTSVNTYFDSSYCGDNSIRRLLVCNSSLVRDVLDQNIPEWHVALVIVNSTTRGGSGGGSIATTALSADWINVNLHELGHSAFGLADEYDYWSGCGIDNDRDNAPAGEPTAPNATAASTRSAVKWRHLIAPLTPVPTMENPDCTQCDRRANVLDDDYEIGLFEGGNHYHCGNYRPAYRCRMRSSINHFCRVCVEAIHDQLRPFFGTTPALASELNMIDFGWIGQGGESNFTFELSNVGTVDVTNITLSVDNPNFHILLLGDGTSLSAGQSIMVEVTLGPVMINGSQNGTLEIQSNAATLNVTLTGNICTAAPRISILIEGGGTSLDFGEISHGMTMHRYIEIRNLQVACTAPVEVTLSPLTDPFSYGLGTALAFTLPTPDIDEDYTSERVLISFIAPDTGGPNFNDIITINTPADTTTPSTEIQLSAKSISPPVVDSVLVIDRSGSMSEETGEADQRKIDHAIFASELYVSLLKEDDRIGLVRYNHHSSDAQGDRLLDPTIAGSIVDGDGRRNAYDKIDLENLSPTGATSIGGGIILGSTVLEGGTAESRALVVLTDGRQNTIPDIPAAITQVQNKIPKQRVFAVGLGLNQLEDKLHEITTVTNGTTQITGDLVGDKEFILQKLFVQILSDIADDAFIADPRKILIPQQSQSTNIMIGEVDIAADFIMTFRSTGLYPKYIEIWLEAPNGRIIRLEDISQGNVQNIRFGGHHSNKFFRLGFPVFSDDRNGHIGQWKFWVKNSAGSNETPFYYAVMAKARSNFKFNGRLIQSEYLPGSDMKIILEPTLFGQPINLTEPVEVHFLRPDGVVRIVRAYRDESGSYQGVFNDTSLYGHYNAFVEVNAQTPNGINIKRYRNFTGIILSTRTRETDIDITKESCKDLKESFSSLILRLNILSVILVIILILILYLLIIR